MDLPFPCVKCTDMPNLGQLVVKGKGREIDSPFTGKKYGHAAARQNESEVWICRVSARRTVRIDSPLTCVKNGYAAYLCEVWIRSLPV